MSRQEMIDLMHTIYKAANKAFLNSKLLTREEHDYIDHVQINAALIAARLSTEEVQE